MIKENWNWMKECVYNSLETYFGEEHDIEYLYNCIEDMYCDLIDNEEDMMTKNFYKKNYNPIVSLIDMCECEDYRFCNNLCPLRDACKYYYTNDDKGFEKEEE